MGVFRRLERGLESIVTGTFARVFRSAVQPVEIASALQRELDNSAQILSRDASLVPNDFTVELSPSDHERLSPYAQTLSRELAEVVNRHAATQNYAFTGPVTVHFERNDTLSTGRFRVRSSAIAAVLPARRVGATTDRRPPRPPQGPRDHAGRPVPLPFLEVNGVRHQLEPPGIVLGRGTEADLRITDPGVSRRHAEIRVRPGQVGYDVSVHDMGSTNGIVVNGRRVDQAPLGDGSQILLGNTLLVIRLPGPEGF
ncbi:MAG TPA: DUF3662 and FHA domain-containing protein [Actinopolymorphaceae bacterium]